MPPSVVDDASSETRTAQILGVAGAIHFVALGLVGLRTFARFVRLKTAGGDDVTMVVCAFFAVAGFVCFCLEAQHGLGRHIVTVSTTDLVEFNKIVFYQSVVSATCGLGMLRISIAVSLLRFNTDYTDDGNGGGKRWYSYTLISLIVFVFLYSIFSLLTLFLHCSPVQGHWDFRIHAQCYAINLFTYFGVIVNSSNIFTDVALALLPMLLFWQLRLPLRTRLYLVIVFGLGYAAVAMGAVKVYYQITSIATTDKTFYSSVSFWGFLQLNTGIIAACAPTIRPIIAPWWKSLRARFLRQDPDHRLCVPSSRNRHRWKCLRFVWWKRMVSSRSLDTIDRRRAALPTHIREIEDLELEYLAGEVQDVGAFKGRWKHQLSSKSTGESSSASKSASKSANKSANHSVVRGNG